MRKRILTALLIVALAGSASAQINVGGSPIGTFLVGMSQATGDLRYCKLGGCVMTGVLQVPAGTAAAPTVTGTGATTSGLFFPANAVSASVNGVQQLALTAGGTKLGAADTDLNASIVAQSITVQSALTGGTSDQAGKDFTINGSQGKGTGAGGQILFKVAGAGNTGTVVNALNTALTIKDSGTAGTSAPQNIFANGTAALPGIAWAGATTTGFRQITSGTAVITGGSNSAAFDNSAGIILAGVYPLAWSNSSADATATKDLFVVRRNTASMQMGNVDSATPVAQTLGAQGTRGGTDSNTAAPTAGFTINPPLGTGNAVGDQLSLNRGIMQATGTTQHAATNAFTTCESKTLSNTSATTTAVATVNLASNSGGGLDATITLVATDGTNFDSETQNVKVSFVNKAGTITVGTALISTSTAANNSGSATIGATVTGATPTISLKVTPVYTTIVPTTVTAYVNIQTFGGASTVTCQ